MAATDPPRSRPRSQPGGAGRDDERGDDLRRQSAALVAATAAVALVAGLTTWAAWRFDRNWPLALAPWVVVLLAPAGVWAWLRTVNNTGDAQSLGGPDRDRDREPGALLDRAGLGRRVPLARRNLFADRRRSLLATGGIAVALLLVLLLAGMVDGAMRRLTGYIDDAGADLVISQQGVRTMHMSTSVLPPDIADRARQTPGVAWAEPIRYTTAILSTPAGRSATYVLGYDPAPGRRGGPAELVAGRPPRSGEAVVDEHAADQLEVGVGGQVRVLGEAFTVAGLSTGGTTIANTTVFIPTADFARLRGPAQAYVLVGAAPGADLGALRWRLAGLVPGTGITVQTAEQFAGAERRLVADMSADVMRIMSGIGFAIALAVIALTLFAVTVAKTREYGVVKALGARPGRLAAVVAVQAAWSVTLGLTAATALALGSALAIGRLDPALAIWITPASVARTGAGALLVGMVAAALPIRRVLRVDPAASFRRQT